jgi:hypothetical protein
MTQFPAASLTCIDFRSGTEWGHITTWSEGFLKEHLSCDKGEKKLVKELNAEAYAQKYDFIYFITYKFTRAVHKSGRIFSITQHSFYFLLIVSLLY